MTAETLLWLIPVAPFFGFLVNAFLGKRLSAPAVGAIAVLGPLLAFCVAVLAFAAVGHDGHGAARTLWTWIAAGPLSVNIGLQADALTAVMLLNVTGIGTAIHLYSYGYMHEDPSFSRFMAYLNLFLASMLILVMADNLLLLFVGWEGVGLCSYLLIGFWYEDFANVDAGRKAFIVNRVGDFMFLLGAFILYSLTGTMSFEGMEQAVAQLDGASVLAAGPLAGQTTSYALSLAALCLFGGATGKSAQLPLYVWLPDAMAGPTPVSALIHAATMVTAGIYLIGRMDFLFVLAPGVMGLIGLVAAATALLSGAIAFAQYDIKKVLAYSTVSQLGFMFCGMATTEWSSGLFHVLTHAFFKALLFLSAGAVIHAMHHEQDIRKMGGLWRDLRGVALLFIIGSLALAGVPPFAGFWSKDEILGSVYVVMEHEGGVWIAVWWMLVAAAAMTAFYTTRLVVLTFFGAPADSHRHLHHVHWTMMAALVFLAVLSLFGGLVLGSPGGHLLEHFTHPMWSASPVFVAAGEEAIHHAHATAMMYSIAAVTLGAGSALYAYGAGRASLTAFVEGPGRPLFDLASNKFYVDELYELVVIRPVGWLAHKLWAVVDRMVLDAGLVEGAGRLVAAASKVSRSTQTGIVNVATGSTLAGVVLVLIWMVAHG